MSIFSGLFRSRDKPENRTAGSSYAFFMGNSMAGKYVTERSAMQMTAVYSCVRILAEAVAGLPLHLYRYKDGGGKEKATDPRCIFFCTINASEECRQRRKKRRAGFLKRMRI